MTKPYIVVGVSVSFAGHALSRVWVWVSLIDVTGARRDDSVSILSCLPSERVPIVRVMSDVPRTNNQLTTRMGLRSQTLQRSGVEPFRTKVTVLIFLQGSFAAVCAIA